MYKIIGNGHEINVEEEKVIPLAGFLHICNTAKSKDFALEEALQYLKESEIICQKMQ